MDISRPIFWHQGLFLQPQHFQLADLHQQSMLAPFHRFQQPHFWGVGAIEFRENALGSHLFDLFSGEFVFADGTYVVFPGNAHFVGRSFEEAWEEWQEDKGPFTVYLGLRKWNPAGGNVTVVPSLEEAGEITTRFVTTRDPEETKDLYQFGPTAQVSRMSYVLRIFFATEQDELNEYDLIPLAHLAADGQEIVLSSQFVAPSLSLAASTWLSKQMKEIRDQVTSRCRQIEEIKSGRGMKSGDLEVGDLVQFQGLKTLAPYVGILHHLAEAPDIHPWRAYGVLRQFVGDLSAFSDRISATGEMVDGTRALPSYDHRNLRSCFHAAQGLITLLLDEVVLGGENIVHLAREESLFIGDMEGLTLEDRSQCYLILRTEMPPESVVDAVQTVAKLGSRESIQDLTSRFISGVPLEHLPYPPPGVPQLGHAVYFRIERENPLWDEVERTGGVALYWDTAPEDLQAEIAVQRKM